MAAGPCKNSQCSSYGKPHPNCKCYGGMAHGGDVSFCAKDQPHVKGCRYYADGGDTLPGDIPDSDFQPDDEAPLPSDGKFPDSAFQSPGMFGGTDYLPKGSPDEIPDSEFKPDAESPDEIPDSEFKPDDEPDTSLLGRLKDAGRQELTKAESLGRGIAGPLVPMIESGLNQLGVPGTSVSDQNARQTDYPGIAGSYKLAGMAMSLGFGPAQMMAEAATGSKILQGAISSGIITGGDKTADALLGHGDPNDAVSPYLATGASMLFGGLGGAAGAAASKGLRFAQEAKLGGEASETLAGYAQAAKGLPLGEDASQALKKGYDAYSTFTSNLADRTAQGLGSGIAYKVGGPYLAPLGTMISKKLFGPITQRAIDFGGKYLGPATALSWLANGAKGALGPLLKYSADVEGGASVIGTGIESLFKAGTNAAAKDIQPSDIDDLREYIKKGGIPESIKQSIFGQNETPTNGYAEGGEVGADKPVAGVLKDDPIASHYPAQNMMINAARGRVSNYLSGLQPQENHAKLAFDDAPDDREAKKTYDRALRIAVKPMSILDEVKAGTLEPEHVQHMGAMFPELSEHLSKKITERIVKAQVDGEKPSYKVRQGLSLMLGTPLSGEMTHQAIIAAQSVFASQAGAQPPPNSPASKPKKSSAHLSKSSQSYMTDQQALTARSQRQS